MIVLSSLHHHGAAASLFCVPPTANPLRHLHALDRPVVFSRKHGHVAAILRGGSGSDDAGAPATPPKYMWGSDDYFPASVFFSTFFFAAFLVGVPLAAAGAGASGMSAGMALPEMGGVVLATCGYIWMWYNILGTQVTYRIRAKGGSENGKRATERATGNTLEQMVPFLVSMWLYAAYVDYQGAAILGWIYTLSRALYGPLWAYYGEFTALVEFSTSPAYTVIYTCTASLALKVLTGEGLVQHLAALPLPLWATAPVAMFLIQVLSLVIGWNFPTGYLTARLLEKTCPPPPPP